MTESDVAEACKPETSPENLRMKEAMHRLEMQVSGQAVSPAQTAVDRLADWYAADLLAQMRDYLTKAYADIAGSLATPQESPEVKERRRMEEEARRQREEVERRCREQEAAEEARKNKTYRTEFAECLRAGRIHVWLSGARDPDRFTEVADVSNLVCPVCGQVPPDLDKRILDMGDMLLGRPDRQPECRPDPAHRGQLSIEDVRANRFPIRCTCGCTFIEANAYTYPGAYLPEEGV